MWEETMGRETKSIARSRARKTLGRAIALLFFGAVFLGPDPAHSDSSHGGGFQGGGPRAGAPAFHSGAIHAAPPALRGGGFHPGFHEFHGGGFHGGHFGEFHGERFHHHGFRRGIVVVPALGGLWWGGGWGWPDYYYPDEGYSGYGPGAGYWYYCSDPPGYYPYVAQCNTGWQTVPAN